MAPVVQAVVPVDPADLADSDRVDRGVPEDRVVDKAVGRVAREGKVAAQADSNREVPVDQVLAVVKRNAARARS